MLDIIKFERCKELMTDLGFTYTLRQDRIVVSKIENSEIIGTFTTVSELYAYLTGYDKANKIFKYVVLNSDTGTLHSIHSNLAEAKISATKAKQWHQTVLIYKLYDGEILDLDNSEQIEFGE